MKTHAKQHEVTQTAQPNAQKQAPIGTILQMYNDKTAQRVINPYKSGTLAYTTKAMRGLDKNQIEKVQELHDDPHNIYTIDEARSIAQGLGMLNVSNPYEWDVSGIGSYLTPDPGVQRVLENFGHPTQSVVKTYDDLASRVNFDVGKGRKGSLDTSTIDDLHQMFDASKPLHMGFNPFLNAAWNNNLDDYSGFKTGIPLYGVMRSAITKDFVGESLGSVSLNDVLKEVSGRPSEIHHLLYKAHYPGLATTPENLMLTERSERESVFGPGQHELMHMVFSGQHKNKFNELLPQVVNAYDDWLTTQNGDGLLP